MSKPMSQQLATLVASAKSNQLAHNALGVRGRRTANALLVMSGVLGYIAGVGGLADLIGKTAVAGLGIAAGVMTTLALLAVTMLKSADHLRVAGEYGLLYGRAVLLDESTQEGVARLTEIRDQFEHIAESTNAAGITLTNGQRKKFEKQARVALVSTIGKLNLDSALILAAHLPSFPQIPWS